jgi:cholesterol transport system auxiliary component
MISTFRAYPLLAPLLALGLSACVNIGAKPPGTLLSLTSAAAPAAGSGSSGLLSEAIVVLEPAADARLGVLRVPVQVNDSSVAYLKGAQWVERPSRQFQHLLADSLRARNKGLVIEFDQSVAALKIGGRLLAMGYDARSRSAVVRFDAVKFLPGGKAETRRFENVVPGIAPDGADIGRALNRAANAVASEVCDWVSPPTPS